MDSEFIRHSIQIAANGDTFEVTTNLSLKDLDLNGVAWSQPVRDLESQTNQVMHLGTYLNIAEICRKTGRAFHELAALRRAKREFGNAVGGVTSRIETLSKQVRSRPELPLGWSVVGIDFDMEHFTQLAGHEGKVFNDFWHPGARFGGLFGFPGLDTDEGKTMNNLAFAVDHLHGMENLSFHVCLNDQVIATVPVVIDSTHVIAWVTNHWSVGCIPIEVHFLKSEIDRATVYRVVFTHLKHLLLLHGGTSFKIMEHRDDQFSLYHNVIKKSKYYSAEIWDRPYVDLTVDEKTLFSHVRKSYKSNINWSKRNLTMKYFSGAMVTEDLVMYFYDVIQELHKDVIASYGDGMTRNLFMHPMLMCRNGMGEISLAETVEGETYGLTVTTYLGGIAYYALAGSRTMNGKHVGHYMLYDSLLRAKSAGITKHILNRFFGASVSLNQMTANIRSDRNNNVIFFKRGYSDGCEIVNVYTVFH